MAEPFKNRNPDAHDPLRVIQIGADDYYVESSKGKVCYRVTLGPSGHSCACADFTTVVKREPAYICKHVNAVLDQDGAIPRIDFQQKIRPKLDERFLSNIQGKDFVLYSGLLDLAHQKGLRSLKVEAVQYPTKENGQEAICRAELESPTGEIFVEWGDANPTNVNRKIAAHILRMAATRAKARAFRDYTNIGITCLEELGEVDDAPQEAKRKAAGNVVPLSEATKSKDKEKSGKGKGNGNGQKTEPKPDPPPEPAPIQDHRQESTDSNDGPGPSAAQLKAMENLAKRRGVTTDEMENMSQQMFGTSFRNITSSEAASFIRTLQQST